jgi:DNA-binding Lrp family transcriptional regulator
MSAHRKPALRVAIKQMALDGKKLGAIAAELNVSLSSVIYHVRSMLDEGELPRARIRRGFAASGESVLDRVRHKHGVSCGRMSDFVKSLSDEQLFWLIGQVPPGGTFADVLRAIVVDAYEEENDAS